MKDIYTATKALPVETKEESEEIRSGPGNKIDPGKMEERRWSDAIQVVVVNRLRERNWEEEIAIADQRREVLKMKDTVGTMKLWEIMRGLVAENYGEVPFEKKKEEVFEMVCSSLVNGRYKVWKFVSAPRHAPMFFC